MRIHALLNWWDEPTSALAATITSLKLAAVDSVIAIDGVYALYPDQRVTSPPDQAAVIHETARHLGMACTIHTPNTQWHGNEVQKRTALFDMAYAMSEPGDWWFVIDADTVVTSAPPDLKHQLETTDLHVAEATLTELRDLNDPQAGHFNWARAGSYPFRMLFRAQRIHCQTNHYTYVTEDGLTLWESDSGKQEPALPVDGLHCEHRANQRALDRIQDKNTYYTRRDKLGIERGSCIWQGCDDQATQTVAHNFRRSTNAAGYVADLAEACAKHAKRIDHENRWTLRQWGIDLDTADVQLRDGAAA
jgi:hypothetical protein